MEIRFPASSTIPKHFLIKRNMNLTAADLQHLESKGIPTEKLNFQLRKLKEGFPYLTLVAPATPQNGIVVVNKETEETGLEIWNEFLAAGGKVIKMVPASGAASRMFKDLFAFLNGAADGPDNDFLKKFFNDIEKFAFFPALNSAAMKLYGLSVLSLIEANRYKDVVFALLDKEGLDYGQLPKALLEFHKIAGSSRTPLAEHLAEGAQYAAGKEGKVEVHFTVSPEHRPLVEKKIEEIKKVMEHLYGVEYVVTLSEQKPSTDTVAALESGEPYREDGKLFFRPGGHGALIENLNDLDADIVFIKNIDNVVPDDKRETTNRFKKIIGGILVGLKQRADEYCRLLRKGTPSAEKLMEIEKFLRNNLHVINEKVATLTDDEKAAFLFAKLNRPMRVAGMVKNEGEPGGGPFIIRDADGTTSLQILESTQIDTSNPESAKMLRESSHFNPVDLVCAIKDYNGKPFNLPEYVDEETGFISSKSRKGVEFKALELPGLWNGAMSRWNTVFVEVPAETFNPVKTVNDLLRPAHQN